MEQRSWEANQFSASQGIPRILWNLKVHYHIRNCQPPVPILSQLDQVHNTTSYFLKINLNIILLSMPGSPKWSLSLRFLHQNPVYTSPPYVLHAPPILVMRTQTAISPAGLSRCCGRPHRILCSTNTYRSTLCSITVYDNRDCRGLEMNQGRSRCFQYWCVPCSILQWIWAEQK